MHLERLDRFMFEPVEVRNWLLLVYESRRHLDPRSIKQVIAGFVRGCLAVGKTFQASSTGRNYTKDQIGIRINHEPAVVRQESGHGIIARVSRLAAYYPVDG